MLCDKLFLNAAARREQLCVRELGPAFNYVGSELRRPAGNRTVLPPAAAACLARASPCASPCATPYATLYATLYASPRHTPPDACNPRTQGAHQATLVRAPRRAARRVCRAPHAQGAETVHCRLARAPLARGRRRAAVRPQRLGATGSALAAGDARSNARPRTQVQLRGGALPRPVGRLRPAAVGRGRQPHVPCGHMTVDPRARSEMGDAAYCSNLIRWGASSSQEKRTCKNIKKRFEVKLNQNRARAGDLRIYLINIFHFLSRPPTRALGRLYICPP